MSSINREGRKLAKKERRQRAKDGECGQTFAGNDFDIDSFEDDDEMQEIVIIPTCGHQTVRSSSKAPPDSWASPILNSIDTTTPSSITAPPAACKKLSLRRGKRDLMKSWLETPTTTSNDHQQQQPQDSHEVVSPIMIGRCADTSFSHSNDHRSVGCGGSSSTDPFVLLQARGSSLFPSFDDAHQFSPAVSISTAVEDVGPSETSSSMSVIHSRPRDTIRSIHALRTASMNSVSVGVLVNSDNLSASAQHQQHQSLFRRSIQDVRMNESPRQSTISGCEALPDLLSSVAESNISHHQHHYSPTLSLHPGPKPRNVVTFNADAYNLDAWDADVMGLFALPTEGVTGMVNRMGSSPSLFQPCPIDTSSSAESSWCDQNNNTTDTVPYTKCGVSPQPSHAVLSAYFDQSRSSEAYQNPLQVSWNDQQNVDDEKGEISTNAEMAWKQVLSPMSIGRCSIGSPSRSPAISAANTSTALFNEHLKNKDYLLQVAIAHANSTTSPITVHCAQVKNANEDPFQSGTSLNCMIDGGSVRPMLSLVGRPPRSSLPSFSDIASKYVTVDTLVHQATSYTEQLANPTSGAGHQHYCRLYDRWSSPSTSSLEAPTSPNTNSLQT